MTGPRPAGRPWTRAEQTQIASGAKIGLIARKLKRSPGTIYARIISLRKMPRGAHPVVLSVYLMRQQSDASSEAEGGT
jgi:hypothetical protein